MRSKDCEFGECDCCEQVMELTEKLQFLLDFAADYMPLEDGRFTFHDGDTWRVGEK